MSGCYVGLAAHRCPWSVEETAVRFVVPWATSFPIGIYAQLRDQTRLHAASLISC